MLVEFAGKRPAAISKQELEAYFLHRRHVDRWSPHTMRIGYLSPVQYETQYAFRA